MEFDENALLTDPHLEQNLRRLREEERQLLDQQATMEAGTVDDIAALEHQDALRLNHLKQQELHKQQALQAQRLALRQALLHGGDPVHAHVYRREHTARRRTTCTVRVNNLHAAEAIETDV